MISDDVELAEKNESARGAWGARKAVTSDTITKADAAPCSWMQTQRLEAAGGRSLQVVVKEQAHFG